VDAAAAARVWAAGWSRAWPARDQDQVASLYADDAEFRSHPFREPHRGPQGARDYALRAFRDEDEVRCWFGEPRVTEDGAVVEYWATLVEGGRDATIVGVSLLRFSEDGRVSSQRDHWHVEAGRREPYEGWGR
jgi:ketosteroid isomerase-like protein